jgi:hypothetical protein
MLIIQKEPLDSPLKSLVLRLGGFHTEMSFIGSIGHIMSGSGLTSMLETVYAPTAVSHMMSGKAIARAVRGHFLVDTALTTLMMSEIYGLPLPKVEGNIDQNGGESIMPDNFDEQNAQADISNSDSYPEEIKEAKSLLNSFLNGDVTLTEINQSVALDVIQRKIIQFRLSRSNCRTANLWFQYMDMISILRDFIKAERTGNWRLHIESLKDMLPYFAAAGHNLYVKSACIYIQQMECLKEQNPGLVALFESGFHVIRRSDKYWAGISSDLAIEQVLMRSIKATGGLTRGRGMNENQRALWILSMPDCAEVNSAMQTFAGTNFYSSDQHKEDGKSRQKRDSRDTTIFASFLAERNPFAEDECLRNIETGVSATKDVNSDRAKEIGERIIESMNGKSVSEFTFKRKHQVVIFQDNPLYSTSDRHENLSIDPQLLFQRFIIAADNIYEDKSEIFAYELSSHPSSMFESSGFMRSSQKSLLADSVWNLGDCSGQISDANFKYVVDGGSLIHKIPWQTGMTFGEICARYIESLKCYGLSSTVVVFDGYTSGPDTKDALHLKRTKGIVGTKVTFSDNTPFRSKKDTFLANPENKQNFIQLLSKTMEDRGIKTKQALGDADVLIADTAVESSLSSPTVLLGEDTDLLVLLLYHCQSESETLIFRPNHREKNKTIRIWDIKKTKNILGNEICKLLPVIHAVSGCDTTSKLYGIGKGATLKKFLERPVMRELGEVFLANTSVQEITDAGEKMVTCLYGGCGLEGIDIL